MDRKRYRSIYHSIHNCDCSTEGLAHHHWGELGSDNKRNYGTWCNDKHLHGHRFRKSDIGRLCLTGLTSCSKSSQIRGCIRYSELLAQVPKIMGRLILDCSSLCWIFSWLPVRRNESATLTRFAENSIDMG
jgi:hypothetical protein